LTTDGIQGLADTFCLALAQNYLKGKVERVLMLDMTIYVMPPPKIKFPLLAQLQTKKGNIPWFVASYGSSKKMGGASGTRVTCVLALWPS
jgi:hypothetical protein